jgi:hypothetical protein
MKIKEVRIGQCVRHPDHDGTGDVTRIESKQIEVFFNHGKTLLDEKEVEKLISLDTLDTSQIDIQELISKAVIAGLKAVVAQESGVELAKKYRQGVLILQPADPALASKEIDLETFFHKIVMVRDNLRVLEQKLNSHKELSELDKVELQQYLTRVAGSLTTFNCLFQNKEEYF